MKDQKGVTLTSLIIYVVVLLVVIVMLGVMRNNFQNGVMGLSEDSKTESEFNKFNIYFIKDIKKAGTTVTITGENNNEITFSSGNTYEFSNNNIYFISGEQRIKLLENINNCSFNESNQTGKTIVNVSITFSNNKTISKDYVLAEEIVGNSYQDEGEYVSVVKHKKELKYIESTGTQYIDTGYSFETNNVKIEIDFKKTSSANGIIIGSINSTEYSQYHRSMIFYTYGSNSSNTYFGLGDADTLLNINFSVNERAKPEISYDGSTFTLKYLGNSYTQSITKNIINNSNICIFGTKNSKTSMNLYSCKIWDDENLVRDFIPVLDENNVACLYDKVSGEYFYNQGTGDFIAGPETEHTEIEHTEIEHTEIGYIESTGTQYIDTGYSFETNNAKIEIDFEKTSSTNGVIIGSINSTEYSQYHRSMIFYTYGSNSSNTYFGLGDVDTLLNINFGVNERAKTEISYDGSTFTLKHLGNSYTQSITKNIVNNSNICIFTTESRMASMKLYSCKIWDNENLVRDFIPVLDGNNVACLYDKVSEEYFYSQGNGAFIPGPQI